MKELRVVRAEFSVGGRRCLLVKTDGHSEDERLGSPIELQWRITPLLNRINRRLVEKRLGSKHTDAADKTVGVDSRFENHVADSIFGTAFGFTGSASC